MAVWGTSLLWSGTLEGVTTTWVAEEGATEAWARVEDWAAVAAAVAAAAAAVVAAAAACFLEFSIHSSAEGSEKVTEHCLGAVAVGVPVVAGAGEAGEPERGLNPLRSARTWRRLSSVFDSELLPVEDGVEGQADPRTSAEEGAAALGENAVAFDC